MSNACIITIGNEIIDGTRLDTNSQWISKKIEEYGIITDRIISIGDNITVISETIKSTIDIYDYIFITGGLGPTHDDVTLSSFKEVFNLEEKMDLNYLDKLNRAFLDRGIKMPDINKNQAIILEGCDILDNPYGTARGIYYNYSESFFFIMPGVPYEMYKIMDKIVIPLYLGDKIDCNYKTICTSGAPESKLAESISEIMSKYDNCFSFSFLPSYKGVDFILKASNIDVDIDKVSIEFYNAMQPYSFGYNNHSFSEFIISQLSEKNISIALAESCTGGYLGKILTDTTGASKVFYGSIVAYSNAIKINELNISQEKLNKHGAVSSQVSEDMAYNIRSLFKSDLGLSVTGISDPKGSVSNKAVGLVYISISFKDISITRKFNFNLDRDMNRKMTCYAALNMIRKIIND